MSIDRSSSRFFCFFAMKALLGSRREALLEELGDGGEALARAADLGRRAAAHVADAEPRAALEADDVPRADEARPPGAGLDLAAPDVEDARGRPVRLEAVDD